MRSISTLSLAVGLLAIGVAAHAGDGASWLGAWKLDTAKSTCVGAPGHIHSKLSGVADGKPWQCHWVSVRQ